MTTPFAALQQIWTAAGCEPAALGGVTLTGADPMLPTDVKVGTAATAVVAARGPARDARARLAGVRHRIDLGLILSILYGKSSHD